MARASGFDKAADADPANRIGYAAERGERLLADRPGLSPFERVQVAQLLNAVGRDAEALPLAFRAYREAPDDPPIHRAFSGLALVQTTGPTVAGEVGPDTHVRLTDGKGEVGHVTVLSAPPIDPRRGELSVADAAAVGLLGKKVGDEAVEHEGRVFERRWTVEAVVPALVHAVQDAMLEYERRFPREGFFTRGYSIGDGTSVKDFAPLIADLENRKAHVTDVFALCREHTLPLGFVAKKLGIAVAEVMKQAMSQPETYGALLVEWADAAGQEESRAAAAARDPLGLGPLVIVDTSALPSAERGTAGRANQLRVDVLQDLVRECDADPADAGLTTAILTPYRAQAAAHRQGSRPEAPCDARHVDVRQKGRRALRNQVHLAGRMRLLRESEWQVRLP